ncbi:hypothetical protein P7C71_g1561, partial [Lecanoromycetidae sp. Uapishka_2]
MKTGPNSSIAVIDMEEANRHGAVQPAADLGIEVNSILSVVSLPDLLVAMPRIPGDEDPFALDLIRNAEYLSEARAPIYADPLPLSWQAGKAIGRLIKAMAIPSNKDNKYIDAAVYSIISDWGFDGTWKKWRENIVFREGVENGYWGLHSGQLMNLNEKKAAVEIEEAADAYENMRPAEAVDQAKALDDDDDDATISANEEENMQENHDQRHQTITNDTSEKNPMVIHDLTFVDGFVDDLREAIDRPNIRDQTIYAPTTTELLGRI